VLLLLPAQLASNVVTDVAVTFAVPPVFTSRHMNVNDDCRLQLCDKQHTTALAAATQFGPPASAKVCSCTVSGLAPRPPDTLPASNASDRSASPASPANSKPASPVSRDDTACGVATAEDQRGTSRSAPAAEVSGSENKADTQS
jgi:hypothetical protein